MLTDYEAMVRAFHAKFDKPRGNTIAWRQAGLRKSLIEEEARETCDAIDAGDMTEVADGLCDLLYVTFGTAIAFGIDIGKYFDEVHRSNMAKQPGLDRADGKVLKPEGWVPPRIREMLAVDGWETGVDEWETGVDNAPDPAEDVFDGKGFGQ